MDNSILPMRSLCSLSESTNLAMDLLVESSDKGIFATYSSISPDSGLKSFTEKLSFAPMMHSHLEGKNAVSRTRWISGFEFIVRPLLANSFIKNRQPYADLLQINTRPSAGLFRSGVNAYTAGWMTRRCLRQLCHFQSAKPPDNGNIDRRPLQNGNALRSGKVRKS